MFRLCVVACLVAAIQGASISTFKPQQKTQNIFPNGKIVGGRPITIDQAPWQVSLEDSGYLFCGGSIISSNYILTAAHCTVATSAEYIDVRSGTTNLQTGGKVTKVAELVEHPKHNSITHDYDVSVLKLAKPLNFDTNQSPISLRKKEAVGGEIAAVTGWGAIKEGNNDLPKNLQSVNVPVVSRNDCNINYNGEITKQMICAGEVGKDSCQGDSGGAITVNNTQIGIVSWGYGCARENYPGIYSNIAALADFISEQSNNEVKWV